MAEGSKTVDLALRLLEEIRAGGPGNAAALARRIGISRSAVGRLLRSLEDARFVRRTDRGYDLGFDLLRFSAALGSQIRRVAAQSLRELATHFAETAVLAVRDGDDAVAVDQVVPAAHVMSIQYRPGTRHPLSTGAHGLAMLADVGLQLGEVEPALVPRLAEVARVGYAVSHGELEPGVTGVAAPIFDSGRRPVAALGIVAPTPRFPDVDAVATAVVDAARSISSILVDAPGDARPIILSANDT